MHNDSNHVRTNVESTKKDNVERLQWCQVLQIKVNIQTFCSHFFPAKHATGEIAPSFENSSLFETFSIEWERESEREMHPNECKWNLIESVWADKFIAIAEKQKDKSRINARKTQNESLTNENWIFETQWPKFVKRALECSHFANNFHFDRISNTFKYILLHIFSPCWKKHTHTHRDRDHFSNYVCVFIVKYSLNKIASFRSLSLSCYFNKHLTQNGIDLVDTSKMAERLLIAFYVFNSI